MCSYVVLYSLQWLQDQSQPLISIFCQTLILHLVVLHNHDLIGLSTMRVGIMHAPEGETL